MATDKALIYLNNKIGCSAVLLKHLKREAMQYEMLLPITYCTFMKVVLA